MDWRSLDDAAKPPPNFPAELAKPVNLSEELFKPVSQPESEFEKAAQSRLSESSESALRKWNVDSDPNVPTEFKRKFRNLLQAKPRQKKKLLAVWSLIAAKNPETLIKPLKVGNHPVRDPYSVEANAICQYLKLAKEHYRIGLGPVTKGELWNRVCAFHAAHFKSGRPTHRTRILNKIGLGSLPQSSPGGRPRKTI
jgi:hypothetical protein